MKEPNHSPCNWDCRPLEFSLEQQLSRPFPSLTVWYHRWFWMPFPQFPADTTPTFTWNDIGANRYEVWLQQKYSQSPAPSDSGSISDRHVLLTSTEVLTGGTYRLWIRANDTDRNVSSWVPSAVFEYPTAKPTLLAPLAAVDTARPTFSWEAVAGASAYQIWIGTSSGRIIESDIAANVMDSH